VVPLDGIALVYAKRVYPYPTKSPLRLLSCHTEEFVQVLSDPEALTVYKNPLTTIVGAPDIGQTEVSARGRSMPQATLNQAF
jgi:hypothetical protein